MADHDHHHHDHQASWQKLAASSQSDDEQSSPGPRSSHALVYASPYVYLLAGERAPRVPVDDQGAVWRIKISDNDAKWERVVTNGDDAPPPCVAPAAAAAAVGEGIYLFGGRTAIAMEQGVLGDLYRLDTSTLTWTKAWTRPTDSADDDAPAPRSYHAAASLAGKFYVFGGCGPSGRLNDLWSFDPAAGGKWERLPDPPQGGKTLPPRGGASLAADERNGRLVVVGGFDGNKELADAHAFDVRARAWCSGPGGCASCEGAEPTLPARSVLGVAAHTGCGGGGGGGEGEDDDSKCSHVGHLVAFGGECDPSVTRSHDAAGKFLGDAWCGDGASGAWHPLKTAAGSAAPCPRGWFASCAVPGGLVLHGGLDASNERLSDCWRLRFGH
jgi:hypothetical protein